MISFAQAYTAMCNHELVPYGFSKYKNSYFRVINDVYQLINYERVGRSLSGRGVRVGFNISPLCKNKQSSGQYFNAYYCFLRNFEASTGDEWDRWYCSNTSESIAACVEEIGRFIRVYLIPLFEDIDCCEKALPVMLIIQKHLSEISIGRTVYREPPRIDNLDQITKFWDSDAYYMALKTGNYDLAIRLRSSAAERKKHAMEEPYRSESFLKEHMKLYQNMLEEIERIQARDNEYIKKMLTENEKYAREVFQAHMKTHIKKRTHSEDLRII